VSEWGDVFVDPIEEVSDDFLGVLEEGREEGREGGRFCENTLWLRVLSLPPSLPLSLPTCCSYPRN